MENRPAWVVSAAIILQRGGWSIHVDQLAEMVMATGMTGLGIRGTTPPKTLRNQLNKNNPHADWFKISENNVSLSEIGHTFAPQYPEVVATLRELFVRQNVVQMPSLAEQILTPDKFLEGTSIEVLVNRYERDPRARQLCIQFYGTSCAVCLIDFGLAYGPTAEGFIHVHHLKPLSEIRKGYEVDPVKDLRPVCPNCHAVIHLGGSVKTIDEVKTLMSQARKLTSTLGK
jgi:predicted HNH restriction endonuclease